MKRVVIHGCYNIGNFGDLLILDLLSQHLEDAWQVRPVCPWVHKTMRSVVKAVPGKGIWDCLGIDLAILGGGGYLTDGHGKPGAVRRLLRYSVPARLWRYTKTPYVIAGVGVGPIGSKKGASRIVDVCSGATVISVRDEESRDLLLELGIPHEKIQVTADLVMTLHREKMPADAVSEAQNILQEKTETAGQRRIGLHFSALAQDQDKLLRFCRMVADRLRVHPEIQPYWIFDHGQSMLTVIRRIAARELPRVRFIPWQQHWTTAALIGELDAVFTEKLHVGIVAWALGVPAFGYSKHPKTKRFYRQIGRQDFQVDADHDMSIVGDWIKLFAECSPRVCTEDVQAREYLSSAARRNFEIIDHLLGDNHRRDGQGTHIADQG